jgi:hypothetical protein
MSTQELVDNFCNKWCEDKESELNKKMALQQILDGTEIEPESYDVF